jgi:hypothetical protein
MDDLEIINNILILFFAFIFLYIVNASTFFALINIIYYDNFYSDNQIIFIQDIMFIN